MSSNHDQPFVYTPPDVITFERFAQWIEDADILPDAVVYRLLRRDDIAQEIISRHAKEYGAAVLALTTAPTPMPVDLAYDMALSNRHARTLSVNA